MHYLDFYIHVERLHQLLEEWQEDAAPALQENCPPTFPAVDFQPDRNILLSLLAIADEKKRTVKSLLEKACRALLSVTERQLSDFLPGGRYHSVHDPELRQKLNHSQTTNLISNVLVIWIFPFSREGTPAFTTTRLSTS